MKKLFYSKRNQGFAKMIFVFSIALILVVTFSVFSNAIARVGSLNLTGVTGSGTGPYTAFGSWSPIGNQCFTNKFHYYIKVFKDLNTNNSFDSNTDLILQEIKPAPCNGDFTAPVAQADRGTGGNWPATGQVPVPATFNLTLGSNNICAVLFHVSPSGNDTAESTDCLDNPVVIYQCSDGVDNDNDGNTDYPNDPGCTGPTDNDETDPVIPPQCSDGVDNDNDGNTDYPNDPGCTGPTDNDETDPVIPPQCSDGVDNDNDGNTDYPNDPGCTGPTDNDETDPVIPPQCSDGVDNDNDGNTDYPNDPGCTGPTDNDETDPVIPPQCSDGVDNDNDGNTDYPNDPGCTGPTDNDETDPVIPPQCSDGVDNDNDGNTDYPNDPGCTGPTDNDETDPVIPPQCSDGVDNDNDGNTDYPNDPGCTGPTDNDETDPVIPPQCSDGVDNDNDGNTDYPNDPGCTGPTDNDETDPVIPPQCSDGVDNDNDGNTDYPNDPGCTGPTDDDENNQRTSTRSGSRILRGGGEVLGAATDICNWDSSYMRRGWKGNKPEDVKKVQKDLLNDYEGNSLVVDGIYGPKTEAAVKAFQVKYAENVLKPWGINTPTGHFYLSSLHQAKKLLCPTNEETPLPPLINWSKNPLVAVR